MHLSRHDCLLLKSCKATWITLTEVVLVLLGAEKPKLPFVLKFEPERNLYFRLTHIAARLNELVLVLLSPLHGRRHLLPSLSPELQNPGRNECAIILLVLDSRSYSGNNRSCPFSKWRWCFRDTTEPFGSHVALSSGSPATVPEFRDQADDDQDRSDGCQCEFDDEADGVDGLR